MSRAGAPGERATRRGIGQRAGDLVLNVAAVLGAICILLVVLAAVFNVSIMMFKTGSMGPTIPAGSIAFVREVPATEIQVGDVVTVSRGEGVLPVTHRVIDILHTDETTGVVTFEMQGDANDVPDPTPYSVAEVRIVMFSVPGLARVIGWFGNPYVLGGLTIAATTLVVWAFWPRRDDDDDGDGDGDGEDLGTGTVEEHPSGQAARRGVAVMLVALGLVWVSQPTAAADGLTAGDHLRMESRSVPQMLNLSPGSSATWTVGVWAEAPEPGEITLKLDSSQRSPGLRPDALMIDVEACSIPWSGDSCPGQRSGLLPPTEIGDLPPTAPLELTRFPSAEQRWLQVTVTLAGDVTGEEAEDLQLALRVHAVGLGDHVVGVPTPPAPTDPPTPSEPRPGLPDTGVSA